MKSNPKKIRECDATYWILKNLQSRYNARLEGTMAFQVIKDRSIFMPIKHLR
jgi:hypothetical protein